MRAEHVEGCVLRGSPATTALPPRSCHQQQSQAEEASLQDHTNTPVPSQASGVSKASNSAKSKAYISCFLFYYGLLVYSPTPISVITYCSHHWRWQSNILRFTLWYADSYQTHTLFLRHTSTLTAAPLFSSLPLILWIHFSTLSKTFALLCLYRNLALPVILLFSSWHFTKQLLGKEEKAVHTVFFSLKLLYHCFKPFLRASVFTICLMV